MITDQDISAAEQELDRAAAAQLQLERRVAAVRSEDVSDSLAASLSVAAVRTGQARRRLDGLRAAQVAELAAVEARGAAESDVKLKRRRKDMAREFELSRERVCAATKVADEALRALIEAAADHDHLVRSAATELDAAGLSGLEHETGADARSGVLKLDGAWHLPLPTYALFMRTAYGVARSTFGRTHDVTRRLAKFYGVEALDARLDGLLAGVPLAAEIEGRRRPAFRGARVELVDVAPHPDAVRTHGARPVRGYATVGADA